MNPIVIQIILAVLVLTALVMGGLSVKTWRAWHVVAGFLVFLTAVGFLILLSMSLKARRVWLKELARLETQYATLVAEQVRLTYGDLASVTAGDDLNSLSNRLHRLTLTQGRVWRGCTPEPMAADGSITVTISGAGPGQPHQIPANSVIYAFREVDTPQAGKIPVTYVGEFQVAAVTENTVQLRSSLPAPVLLAAPNVDFQGQFINGVTWSLYEILPGDDHYLFTDPEQPVNLKTVGEPVFGRPNPEEVRQTLELVLANSPLPVPEPVVQAILQAYLRDGTRVEAGDPPEVQFVKVEFVQSYREKVDSETSQSILSGSFFDAQGEAQIGFLQRGGTLEMPVGSVAVLPKAQADQLINNGTCKEIETVYVRPLTDYAFALRDYYNRLVDLRNQIALTNYNKQKLEQTNANIESVIRSKQDERAKLTEELGQIQTERQFVSTLAQTLRQQLDTLRSELSRWFRANLAFHEELTELEREIIEAVNRASQQASAGP